uniref:Uncharacterized protein n=1 Tax=Glossina austeni TaxID=7395 RepID=A0A1A9V051_GLOAU
MLSWHESLTRQDSLTATVTGACANLKQYVPNAHVYQYVPVIQEIAKSQSQQSQHLPPPLNKPYYLP